MHFIDDCLVIGRAVKANILLTSALMFVVMFATLATLILTMEAREREREVSLMHLADMISERISSQVSTWLDFPKASGDFFEAAGSPDPSEMVTFQDRLRDRFPAVKFTSFVQRVTGDERSSHVSYMHSLGFNDYEIRDVTENGLPITSPTRADYFPALIPGIEGWDLGADPAIGPIIREIQFSDRSLSKILTIRNPANMELELVALYPVLENTGQSGLAGIFVIGLNPSELFSRAIGDLEDQVAIEILLNNDLAPTGIDVPLFITDNFTTLDADPWEQNMSIEGEQLILRVKGTPALRGAGPNWLFPAITTMVALSALTFCGITLVLVQQRKEAVETATKLSVLGKAKDQILSVVTHELKTPLTSVIAFVDILRKNQLNHFDERELNQLEIISRNSAHLNILIDDVLDVSRLNDDTNKLDITSIEVRKFVDEIQADLDPILSIKQQSLIVTYESAEIQLSADARRLEQVLSNLISNASKYSAEGSKIWLTVSNECDNTVFNIRDEGVGISAKNLQRIGEPFFRVANEQSRIVRGTGLGIYIVKSIARLHGGIVNYVSEPGVGTTVNISFPVITDPVAPTKSTAVDSAMFHPSDAFAQRRQESTLGQHHG